MECAECHTRNKVNALTCENCGARLSVAEDTLDRMVQHASVPSLATLFRKGKERGLIGPGFAGSEPGT